MYLSWIEDQKEKHKFAEDYSILTGSFANPPMASKMLDQSKDHFKAQSTNIDKTIKQVEELLTHSLEDKSVRKKRKKLRRPQGLNG